MRLFQRLFVGIGIGQRAVEQLAHRLDHQVRDADVEIAGQVADLQVEGGMTTISFGELVMLANLACISERTYSNSSG
jgi:hypothetical protein